MPHKIKKNNINFYKNSRKCKKRKLELIREREILKGGGEKIAHKVYFLLLKILKKVASDDMSTN